MRSPFNALFEFVTGSGSPFPSVSRGIADGRLVLATDIVPQGNVFAMQVGYITLDQYQPQGLLFSLGAGEWNVPNNYADEVYYADNDDPSFEVFSVDRVTPEEGDPYWRAWVVPYGTLYPFGSLVMSRLALWATKQRMGSGGIYYSSREERA